MIDIKNITCIDKNCYKRPFYNFITEKKPLYCLNHKLEHMINIKNKNCLYKNCKEHAIYGNENERPQYCLSHKIQHFSIKIFPKKKFFSYLYTLFCKKKIIPTI